ncbi:RES domain-containing protein [Mucilaginibacter sp. RS28]|uniref:RES domain-containing protein n=1 Tax=Mucilaginibacter straminoryzae TaxID=2932774 RepID=A0A9X2BF36_9SPHI|nr:RES domain-containing protein [Mucilaginibacter straminoryzae]MCJ8212103.1 RES domain-containing protein [Mucilaginibacter straminoryzae]
MNLAKILFHPATNLPINPLPNKSFREHLKELFSRYVDLIEASTDFSKLSRLPSSFDVSIDHFRTLVNGIIETVNLYYKGNPAAAFEKLAITLTTSKVAEILWKDGTLPAKTNFFRLRRKNGNYPLNKSDLFHIPFEQRGRVRTQRYSIPGLPSLYLSNCIYVAWEEMLRPDFADIQAVRLQNVRALKFLDLTTDDYNLHSLEEVMEFSARDIFRKIFTWPLIAACSFRISDLEASFKPEYIIPQLLLQWTAKMDLDGIKYSSTHIQKHERQHTGSLYNMVLPVRTFDLDRGYCPKLCKLFNCTQVLPMQLHQFATTTGAFYGQETISSKVNKDIYSLELIHGKEEPYWHTSFGRLEYALQDLPLEGILERKRTQGELKIQQKNVITIPKGSLDY